MDLMPLSVLAGPNSAGKSNILRAIEFAFRVSIPRDVIYENLSRSVRDKPGSPGLSIYIDILLENISEPIGRLAGLKAGSNAQYTFRAIRSGTVTRKLNGVEVSPTEVQQHYSVMYIPAIRDLDNDGISQFRTLLAQALGRARGEASLGPATTKARDVIRKKARMVLGGNATSTARSLGFDRLEVDTDGVSLSELQNHVRLTAVSGGDAIPLDELGTGHQSSVVIGLYRELARTRPGETTLLLEEPDNHLHPTTTRDLTRELQAISSAGQVIATTHSPVLLSNSPISSVMPVRRDRSGFTMTSTVDLGGFTEPALRRLLSQHNLRITESLLSDCVVVVEGQFDALAVHCGLGMRLKATPESRGVLIVPAGGKHPAAELCRALNALGVNWCLVLDNDGAFSPEIPHVRQDIEGSDRQTALAGIAALERSINADTRRGRKALKSLDALKSELEGHTPRPRAVEGSCLEPVLDAQGVSRSQRQELQRALENGQHRRVCELLEPHRVWLWRHTMDEAVLPSGPAAEAAYAALVSIDAIRPMSGPGRIDLVRGRLSKAAHEPDVVAAAMQAIENSRRYSRSEMHAAMSFLSRRIEKREL